ncbi:Uncharacterised protein [Vibrio cholerae]|uniref:Uncharacterized protein n=1 Tax=Vibrio cholerae TaxID=666 RepID=A0A655YHD9_VIBCL|nr:Uncharacterised protein [Vibrio cholerae]
MAVVFEFRCSCVASPLGGRYNAMKLLRIYQGMKWKNIGIQWFLSYRYRTLITH